MSPITPGHLNGAMRSAAWQRAKGELHAMLEFYFPEYDGNGNKIPNGYEQMSARVQQFIAEVEDNL